MDYVNRQVLGYTIQAACSRLDDGVAVLLTGGQKSHIGAVSTAEPDGTVRTLDFPGHREREVAEQWAAELAKACGCRAAVACGIHYDDLTREGLGRVLRALDEMRAEVIQRLERDTCLE